MLTSTSMSVGYGAVWLGGTDAANEGVWETVTGEPWVYSNWMSGEPNNSGDEDYLELYSWGGGGWNDLPGSYTLPFALEFDVNKIVEGRIIRVDDEFVLIGCQGSDELAVAALAAARGTNQWEVVATLSRRLPRRFLRGGKPVAVRTLVDDLSFG